MQKIRIRHISAGQWFDQALFLPTGQKLIGAQVQLTERHVEALRRCGNTELCLAESVEELLAHGEIKRSENSIKVGQKADRDILSSSGHVVVEAGEVVEEHHLDALVDELKAKTPELPMRVSARTENAWVQPEPADSWPNPDQLTLFRHEHVQRIRRLYAKAESGVGGSIDDIEPVVDALLDRLSKHPTRFTQLALMCQGREDYLPDHAFTATVPAMGIALNLRWSHSDIKAIGLAGIVYDLGMLLVPERIRIGACELTDIDRGRVQRHPVFSVPLIQTIKGVPPVIPLAALQHPERENGSGYPEAGGRTPSATTPRPHRPLRRRRPHRVETLPQAQAPLRLHGGDSPRSVHPRPLAPRRQSPRPVRWPLPRRLLRQALHRRERPGRPGPHRAARPARCPPARQRGQPNRQARGLPSVAKQSLAVVRAVATAKG